MIYNDNLFVEIEAFIVQVLPALRRGGDDKEKREMVILRHSLGMLVRFTACLIKLRVSKLKAKKIEQNPTHFFLVTSYLHL